MAQVVDPELQFVALGREGAWGRHHSRVVEQQIQPSVALTDRSGGCFNAVQISQVEIKQLETEQLMLLQLALARFSPGAGAAGQDHGCAACRQGANALQAKTAIGTGDQRNTSLQGRDVFSAPAHRRSVFREQ